MVVRSVTSFLCMLSCLEFLFTGVQFCPGVFRFPILLVSLHVVVTPVLYYSLVRVSFLFDLSFLLTSEIYSNGRILWNYFLCLMFTDTLNVALGRGSLIYLMILLKVLIVKPKSIAFPKSPSPGVIFPFR